MVQKARKSQEIIEQAQDNADKQRRPSLLRIGEVAGRSGVGVETLRFYERSRLLDQPARTENGYRLYGEEVLERLAFIKRAQALGFSLDEIGRVIAEKRAGRTPCAEVREIVRRRLRELDERMAQMRRYRREVAAALAEWDKIGESEGHICGLIEDTQIEPMAPSGRNLRKRDNETISALRATKWSAKSSLTRDQFVSQKLPENTPAFINRSWRLNL
jgi:DNA-binding transcriptional MerR regulator